MLPSKVSAQVTTTAEIVGTVSDQAGSVIPGATIAVTNKGTGDVRAVKSGSTGDFDIPLLPPGNYSITVTLTSFKKYEVPNITLAAGDKPRVNAQLAVGDTSQTISVEASTPLLQSESATLQSSVTPVTVQDLPLNGRNFVQLAQMIPGANEGPPNSLTNGTKPDDKRQTASFSANGASEVLNNQMMDGMDNNEGLIGSIGVRPSVDAIQELRVETSVYPADSGRTAGAVVNIITKSGTNSFHGDVYEYFRNDIFNSYAYQFGQHNAKPEWRQNQYGGSIGGPIVHNKTFFFGDYEGFRLVNAANPTVNTVPTLWEEQHPGNFTDQNLAFLASAAGAPYGGASGVITGLDSAGLNYLALFPNPNLPDIGGTATKVRQGQFVGTAINTQYSHVFDVRLDHNINQNNQLFGRYSYNNVKTWNPGSIPAATVAGVTILPAGPGYSPSNDHNVSLSYTHTFSPSLLAQLQLGYLRVVDSTLPAYFGYGGSVAPAVNTAFGMPNVNLNAFTSGLARVGVNGGYAALGAGGFTPLSDNSNAFQGLLNVTYTKGAHNFKFGGGIIRRHLKSVQSSAGLPQYTIADIPSLEQGVFTNVNRSLVTTNPYYRRWEESIYAQDDWHITSTTTLNLGLRYDILTPFTELYNHISTWNMATQSIMVAGQNGVSSTAGIRTWYGGVQPRIGLSQTLGHGMVLHAGFGIAVYSDLITSNATPKNPPILATFTTQYGTASAASFGYSAYDHLIKGSPALGSALFANIDPTNPVGAVRAATDPNFQPGVNYQMMLNLQKDIHGNVITLGYSGALERHAPQSFTDINEPAPNPYGVNTKVTQGGVNIYQLNRPYYSKYHNLSNIGWYASEGSGSYHSAQASVARRLSNGLSYNVNYTYARNLDNMNGMSSQNSVAWGTYAPVSNWYDYGNSDIDLRNRAAAVVNYALPFGAGTSGLKAAAIKDWQVNLIGAWNSGQPFSVVNATSVSGSPSVNVGDRTNRLAGNPYAASKGLAAYLNAANFVAQTTGTLGNEQRNAVYGPHFRHLDMSVIKNFQIREALHAEFRAEAFNITNTTNFSTPNATLGNGNFNTITALSPAYNPRLFQFALKLAF
jgi:hypothetical protein